MREKLKKSIDSMLERGIIRHSTPEWASPIVLVRKKTDELRVCIDYRVLNKATIKDAFPIPNKEDLVYQLNLMLIATTFDLVESYNQVLVKEEDRPKTAFVPDWGLFECNVMSFGLTNTPATFQRMMTMILGNEIGKSCLVYLDNILIYSSDREQHFRDAYVICFRLAASGLKLKWKKCKVEQQTEVEYLGHIISSQYIKPSPLKVQRNQEFEVPKTIKEMRGFLVLMSYFRKFI